jgi:hypothetical protein
MFLSHFGCILFRFVTLQMCIYLFVGAVSRRINASTGNSKRGRLKGTQIQFSFSFDKMLFTKTCHSTMATTCGTFNLPRRISFLLLHHIQKMYNVHYPENEYDYILSTLKKVLISTLVILLK